MAEINTTSNGLIAGRRTKAGVPRLKKHSLKTDMTPMVDLGFLLITFFVFTAQLSEKKTMDLYMPKDGPPRELGESSSLTVLLGKNNTLYYYHGDWTKAVLNSQVLETNFSFRAGFGNIIREKQKALDMTQPGKEGRKGLMLIIKPGREASYKNVVDMLDEVLINDVKKYVVVKPSSEELGWMKKK